ncbi:helix-turn-helix transcriptional regulator [Falsiroseomonas sp.]|uniref:helix-turn-helix transcriptional regulator n=1 Tax=Falsiroseomonas sp. TaxID=2870721 RepID=UPI003F6F2268
MLDALPFEPDWTSPPGATIAGILNARALPRETLAQEIDLPVDAIHRLLLGLEAIDALLAEKLSAYLGSSPQFWLRREAQYRADLRRIRQAEVNSSQEIWVKQFPVKEMADLGWIAKFHSLSEAAHLCLQFFDVQDVPSWHQRYAGSASAAAFRISSAVRTDPGAVCAWLRWAELVASRTPTAPWNAEQFRNSLSEIRRLTWQRRPAVFLPALRRICAAAGVGIVVARAPKGCPASGATRFVSPSKALMVLSFRYKTDDQFWFTFFHEAGHLLLHGPDALFLEDGSEVTSVEEAEANEFAESILIPAEYSDAFSKLRPTANEVISFSRHIGVAPGIVVGQLQHRGRIGHDRLPHLKRRYDWGEIGMDRLIP